MTARVITPMPMSSHLPDRVFAILRSSTRVSRDSEIRGMVERSTGAPGMRGAGAGRGDRCGAHAAVPSRWVSAVSWRKRSSRPAPSAGRSSSRARPSRGGEVADLARARRRCAARLPREPRGCRAGAVPRRGPSARTRPDVGAAGLEQLLLRALRDDPAPADEDQVVGDLLDLVQQVGGEQHGAALRGVLLEQPAHPVDARRVEAVGGLVEDQHARVAEQCVGDPEALAHPERVVLEPAPCLDRCQGDQLQHLVDPRPRAGPWSRRRS